MGKGRGKNGGWGRGWRRKFRAWLKGKPLGEIAAKLAGVQHQVADNHALLAAELLSPGGARRWWGRYLCGALRACPAQAVADQVRDPRRN